MANWKHTLNLADFYRNNSFTIKEKAKLVASRLRRLSENLKDNEIEDIVYEFEDFANCSDELDVNDFDELMVLLYDFADRDHIIWVKTF